jgi:carbonic anhydrase/acetyltransferase-like protein (isoleucine patch superfamily)
VIVPFGPFEPQIAAGAWVAPTATVIGDVVIEDGASIWYGVVIRADRARIRIGARSNVQDNAVFHADPGAPVDLGADVTVGHGAIVHGATVQDGSLIGMGATLLNHSVVGAGSLVAAAALVREGQVIPPGSMVAGVPAKILGPVPAGFDGHVAMSVSTYERLRDEHREATQ